VLTSDNTGVSTDDYFASVPREPGGSATPDEQMMLAGAAMQSRANMAAGQVTYPTVGRLGFFDSIRAGFGLIPTCWSVLAGEPSLLLVPLVVLVASIALLLGYADILGGIGRLVTGNKYSTAVRVFPIAALCSAVAAVGQAVIVSAATDRLQGKPSSLSSAWVTTLGQLPRLVLFGVVLAGERTLTSLLRGKRWSPLTVAANVIDRAWDFATFLVIPVILFEDVPVFAAVKRSGRLVASRWGTQLTARSVLSLSLFVASLPLIVVAILLVTVSPALGIALLVLDLLTVAVVSAALTGVLSAAMYRFAVTGLVVPGFREADMWAAFGRR
jgi:hypothetical protein